MAKKQTPYVSLVMTSYNREHYIGQAIDGILAQECNFPFEIIIGDDCSTDNSRALLQGYKDKMPDVFVLNFHEKNVGFGPNWASTCKMARGKYIAFCDDDDYWCDTHRMQEMVDYMDAHENCGLVYTNRWILDVATDTKKRADVFIPDGVDKLDYMMHKGYPIFFSATMIRKSMMNKYVDLDAFIRLKFPIQDFPTAVQLAPHCDFHYMEKPSVVYRSYAGSMSKPQEYETVIAKYTKEKVMYNYLNERLGLPDDSEGFERYMYGILLNLAYKRRDYRKAREFAMKFGERTLKAICARTWVTFQMFGMLKQMRNKI